MKLKAKVSWLTNRLQQYLFPELEECYELALTKEENLSLSDYYVIKNPHLY